MTHAHIEGGCIHVLAKKKKKIMKSSQSQKALQKSCDVEASNCVSNLFQDALFYGCQVDATGSFPYHPTSCLVFMKVLRSRSTE